MTHGIGNEFDPGDPPEIHAEAKFPEMEYAVFDTPRDSQLAAEICNLTTANLVKRIAKLGAVIEANSQVLDGLLEYFDPGVERDTITIQIERNRGVL